MCPQASQGRVRFTSSRIVIDLELYYQLKTQAKKRASGVLESEVKVFNQCPLLLPCWFRVVQKGATGLGQEILTKNWVVSQELR